MQKERERERTASRGRAGKVRPRARVATRIPPGGLPSRDTVACKHMYEENSGKRGYLRFQLQYRCAYVYVYVYRVCACVQSVNRPA